MQNIFRKLPAILYSLIFVVRSYAEACAVLHLFVFTTNRQGLGFASNAWFCDLSLNRKFEPANFTF